MLLTVLEKKGEGGGRDSVSCGSSLGSEGGGREGVRSLWLEEEGAAGDLGLNLNLKFYFLWLGSSQTDKKENHDVSCSEMTMNVFGFFNL